MTSEQAVIIIVIAFSLSAANPSRSDANPEPIIDKVNKSDGAVPGSALAPAYNELCPLVSIRIKLFSVLRIVLSCFGKKIKSFEYLHKRKIGSNLSLSNCQRVH